MKDLLLYTACSGVYYDYARLWTRCIELAYPEYDHNVTVLANPTTTYMAALYRLLHRPVETYKYIYITDVDMMILREDPSLLDFHVAEMDKTGLCYSNQARRKEPMGNRRLTGLHFCSQEWYKKTKKTRDLYMHMLDNGELGNNRFDDELMLMRLCHNSDIDISPHLGSLIARHHGIHVGTLRSYKSHTREKQNSQLRMRISPVQAKQWLDYYQDDQFRSAMSLTMSRNKTLKWEFETLYSFCMRRIKEL